MQSFVANNSKIYLPLLQLVEKNVKVAFEIFHPACFIPSCTLYQLLKKFHPAHFIPSAQLFDRPE